VVRGLVIVLLAACGRFGFSGNDAVAARGCVKQFTAYGDQVCALRSDGALYCWGGNGDGQVGDDSTMNRAVPVHIPLQASVRAMAGAQTHTCAVLSDDTGWCWGSNSFGQLGYDTPTSQLAPQPAPVAGNVAITLGDNVTCAIRADSSLACFGRDDEGELGDGMTTSRSTAMRVAAIADPIVSAAGGCHRHLCAATSAGDVWCWGENMHGEVGTGMTSMFESTPVRVVGVPPVAQVTVGAYHSCARTMAGEIWCWGENSAGQLGDGALDPSYRPVRVDGLGTPSDVQATCSGTHVLLDDGSLVAWGQAALLGTGDAIDAITPVESMVPCL
jgi:alpha-tubulin suppressor-like RCC1 family protein